MAARAACADTTYARARPPTSAHELIIIKLASLVPIPRTLVTEVSTSAH